ncbi:CaiB/BaiF CoA-transferase family protein [Chitinivorax sp. PXF-14]|uniref:CaiB/BaiF CoA transferase family protein n=1 Tax=Chitinivorax sp. PXF-14 TaxID=3230488 RepID=UPI003467E060
MSAPLSSLRILDFTTLLPGPFASLLLADLGADVIRIESPTRPDLARLFPPYADGQSTTHGYLNRNKRSLALDLKKPEALDIVKRLVADYDIVIEQFRPGVMDRLGLGFAALKAINPRLIYCSVTGYGQTGPLRDRAGHDINYLALSGLASYTGRQGSGPLPLGPQLADVAGGSLHAVIGILAAVTQRAATGEGAHIDISMTDCAFSLNAMSGAAALAGGVEPGWEAGLLNGGSFYDYYETADGQWLSVGSLEPQFMAQLAAAVDAQEIAGLSLAQDPTIQANLKTRLRMAFRQQPLAHWLDVFRQCDACVEPVLAVSQAASQPQAMARGWVVDVPTAEGGSQCQMACPIRIDGWQAEYRQAGGAVGSDTQAILHALGYSGSDVARLGEAGVLG